MTFECRACTSNENIQKLHQHNTHPNGRSFCRHPEQIPQAEDRYDLYLENKSWEKAAEAAARLKDPRYVGTGLPGHSRGGEGAP